MTTHPRAETVERTPRSWGWYETVAHVAGYKVKRIRVDPGRQISLQKHLQRAEHWVVVLGLAHITVGAQVLTLPVGGHVDIGVGAVHRLATTRRTRWKLSRSSSVTTLAKMTLCG
jgi:mannose-6-phosphate isomerase